MRKVCKVKEIKIIIIIIIIIKCIYRASFPYGSKTLYNKIIKIITNIKLLSKKKYYYYYCLKEKYYNKK